MHNESPSVETARSENDNESPRGRLVEERAAGRLPANKELFLAGVALLEINERLSDTSRRATGAHSLGCEVASAPRVLLSP